MPLVTTPVTASKPSPVSGNRSKNSIGRTSMAKWKWRPKTSPTLLPRSIGPTDCLRRENSGNGLGAVWELLVQAAALPRVCASLVRLDKRRWVWKKRGARWLPFRFGGRILRSRAGGREAPFLLSATQGG